MTTDAPQPFAPPGSGWPGDPATETTPVAHDAADVRRLAGAATTLDELDARVSVCRACPRLVSWRERVALERRRSFADESYWGRPVPGWGAESPRLLVIGLAPAAHGGNRTGRVFTGDRSGDLLYASLHSIGVARQAVSLHADDGQQLYGVRLVAPVRCAPPDNKPTPIERDTCAPWLDAELGFVLPHLRAVVALGAYAWQSAFAALGRAGLPVPRPRPAFGHGVEVQVGELLVVASFHPSQQNTFTGKLTADMLTAVLARAATYAGAQTATHMPRTFGKR